MCPVRNPQPPHANQKETFQCANFHFSQDLLCPKPMVNAGLQRWTCSGMEFVLTEEGNLLLPPPGGQRICALDPGCAYESFGGTARSEHGGPAHASPAACSAPFIRQ